jgi:hypothetical protein
MSVYGTRRAALASQWRIQMHMIRKQWGARCALFSVVALLVILSVSRPAIAEEEDMVVGSGDSSLNAGIDVGKARSLGSDFRNPESPALGAAFRRAIAGPPVVGAIPTLRAAVDVEESAGSPVVAPQGDRQRDIEREARKLQFGVRGGVALDPELILIGVQAQLGPIFNSNVMFRPSVEFAYGEVTAMFGFNGEFIYRLARSSPQDRWSTYVGGGLGINLLHQTFERDNGGKRIDFGDFHSDSALNILGGVQNRSGMFMELRTSIYSDPSPTLRLIVGYSF